MFSANQLKLIQKLRSMKQPFSMITHRDIKTDLMALKKHFYDLPADNYLQKRLKLPKDKIMRRRRMIDYNIEFDKEGTLTTFHEDYRLKEYNEKQTLQYANLYEEISPEMKADQNYKDFIYNTLNLTWQVRQYQKARISVHAVRTISYADQPASPTPEGPNQDGDDLEVICVINKFNCQGAESQIFSPDKQFCLFEMTLDPGEGYINDDKQLWNYATEHRPIDPALQGIRDIIGFKLKIEN